MNSCNESIQERYIIKINNLVGNSQIDGGRNKEVDATMLRASSGATIYIDLIMD